MTNNKSSLTPSSDCTVDVRTLTSRDLLIFAAKAAGLVIVDDCAPVTLYVRSEGSASGVRFNPLSDGEDALRLAVKRGIDISKAQLDYYDKDSTDAYASTLRAIVLAVVQSWLMSQK